MNVTFFTGIFAIVALVVALMFLGTAGYMAYNVLKRSRRDPLDEMQTSAGNGKASATASKRRALDVIAQKKAHQSAHKCHKCGATIDSTAELSADGKVRCNYCNEWTSIY